MQEIRVLSRSSHFQWFVFNYDNLLRAAGAANAHAAPLAALAAPARLPVAHLLLQAVQLRAAFEARLAVGAAFARCWKYAK